MPRTGRPRSFNREVAVDKAMHLFWEHGYTTTSLQDLRDVMGGISAASFYAAFDTKEALFREVIETYVASHGRVLAPLRDSRLSHRKAIETALRASAVMQTADDHPPGCLVGLPALVGGADDADLASFVRGFREDNRAAIRTRVKQAIADGTLAAEAASLASLFETLLVGIAAQARDRVDREEINSAITNAMRLWDEYASTVKADKSRKQTAKRPEQ